MSMSDPIADMLTRLRNAQHMGNKQLEMPSSKLKLAVLKVLADEGFVESFAENTKDGKSSISVKLKYYQGTPVIEKIERVSRPGLRVYKGSKEMPKVRAGMGIAIISTSKGVMTEKAARAQNLGGEVLCTVE